MKIIHSIPCTDSLKAHICEIYNLDLGDFVLFHNTIGAAYLAESAMGKLVFKLSKQNMFDEGQRAAQICDYLRRDGLFVPEIIPTASGGLIAEIDFPEGIRCGQLFRHIDGEKPKKEDFAAIGALLGHFHNAMQNYPGDIPLKFDYNSVVNDLSEVLQCIDKNMADDFVCAAKYLWEKLENAPLGIIHGDFGEHNIIKTQSGNLALIDFDAVCRMPAIIDILIMCNRNAELGRADIEKMHGNINDLMAGYRAVYEDFVIDTDNLLRWLALRHFKRLADSILGVRDADPARAKMFLAMVHEWLIEWKKMEGIL